MMVALFGDGPQARLGRRPAANRSPGLAPVTPSRELHSSGYLLTGACSRILPAKQLQLALALR
jgi:hypothetical protein